MSELWLCGIVSVEIMVFCVSQCRNEYVFDYAVPRDSCVALVNIHMLVCWVSQCRVMVFKVSQCRMYGWGLVNVEVIVFWMNQCGSPGFLGSG